MTEEIIKIAQRAEERCKERFQEIDQVAQKNTERVLESFRKHRVSEACFAGTTGYGYDDLGRETLDKIYAELLGTDAALVRIGFVNGTHALTAALFALAKPGETILSLTGLPYDTLQEAIGLRGDGFGSLKFYGIRYRQIDLAPDGGPDYATGFVIVRLILHPMEVLIMPASPKHAGNRMFRLPSSSVPEVMQAGKH